MIELFALIGGALGILAYRQVTQMKKELERLSKRIERLGQVAEPRSSLSPPQAELTPPQPSPSVPIPSPSDSSVDESPGNQQDDVVNAEPESQIQEAESADRDITTVPAPEFIEGDSASGNRANSAGRGRSPRPDPVGKLFRRIQENWMVWLGGFSVALSGIFLAQYSIERGILGPLGRISMGLIVGVALHLSAEWLRRRQGPHPVFAALVGSGSITLFAVLVAALHLYDLISPQLSFFLLGLVALVTMALARLHGPLVAALGILGAYLVPALVSTGQGNVLIALCYCLIISASALLLLRYVYRTWLLWGMLIGALMWWLIALFDHNADGFLGYYLGMLAYLILAIPGFNWQLNRKLEFDQQTYQLANWRQISDGVEKQLPWMLLLIVVAQSLTVLHTTVTISVIWQFTPLMILLLMAGHHRDSLFPLSWLLLLGMCAGWLASNINMLPGRLIVNPPESQSLLYHLMVTGVIYASLGMRNFGGGRYGAIWASLATVSPMLLLITAYLTIGALYSDPAWAVTALLAGLAYLALATWGRRRPSIDSLVVWLFVAGHLAMSTAAVFVFEATGITLVLALQFISITWVIRSFEIPALGWLFKVLVMVVITRLTLNPWLLDYPTDTHWTLWTYGGAALCALAAYWLLDQYRDLRRWAEGAFLHLFVLFCWTEIRYWLYDGDVFQQDFTFLESALYTSFFGVLSVVYYQRGLRSQSLERFYLVFSLVLLAFSLMNYSVMLLATLTSESWQWQHIGSTRIFNVMLLAYGAPALIALLVYRFHYQRLQRVALVLAGLIAFIFVSLEIRHLWQGELRLSASTGSGELYTYSVVWLCMAITAMLAGAWRYGANCSRVGLGLMLLVIAKIFLVDMSDLDGLLRVASFMGLGLGMLLVSYLYQRLERQHELDEAESSE